MRALVCLILVGCTWSHEPLVYTAAAADTVLFTCDASQTYVASGGGTWTGALREGDRALGDKPSGTTMYGVMALNIGAAIAITAAPLPDWAKTASLALIGVRVAHTVVNNHAYGGLCGL